MDLQQCHNSNDNCSKKSNKDGRDDKGNTYDRDGNNKNKSIDENVRSEVTVAMIVATTMTDATTTMAAMDMQQELQPQR